MCILSQVPDSQNNNNYVAWKKLLLTISLGTASIIHSALWESIQLSWKGIIYLAPEKKWRSLHAPSGYCIAKSHSKASGERFPLAVINPCGLDDLSTQHPLGQRLLGSQTIVSGLWSQTEELRNQAFQGVPITK